MSLMKWNLCQQQLVLVLRLDKLLELVCLCQVGIWAQRVFDEKSSLTFKIIYIKHFILVSFIRL